MMYEMQWEGFPNLQLIGERFYSAINEELEIIFSENKEIIEVQTKANPDIYKTKPKPKLLPEFEILAVFVQNWPNTAGLYEDGGFSGSALSNYYTTVIYEAVSDTYGIFQKNGLVYLIKGTNENVLEDINNHSIKCLKEARERYINA